MTVHVGAFALFLAACASPAPAPLAPNAVSVERAPPPAGARMLKELKAVDGQGCGLFGTQGSYEGAVERLRGQAKALGADYVQVTNVKEPAPNHACVEKEFTVTGVAYVVKASNAQPRIAASGPNTASTPTPASDAAARGLLLGTSGCHFASPAPGTARSLSFTARVPQGARLGAWIDRTSSAAGAEGIALSYEPAARRVALVRKPGDAAVSVGPEPFELDEGWHDWRIQRAPDRIAVWVDEKLLLLHAAAAGSIEGGFLLEGEHVEISRVAATTP